MPESSSSPDLLNAAELQQLGHLLFVARTMVEGLYTGRHSSPKKGHSTEFYDYRAYVRGDDPARVDWKLYGRTDRLYVRRFRHEADLTVHLILDASQSMDFSHLDAQGKMLRDAAHPSKWLYARQLAAAIAYLVMRQGDRVSLSLLSHRAKLRLAPGAGAAHLNRVVHEMEDAECGGNLDIHKAMRELHAQIGASSGKRGLVILISDFWEEPEILMKSFHPFLHDHYDMTCLGVHSPQELSLESMSSLRLVDMESRHSVRTYAPEIRQAYHERVSDHLTLLNKLLRGQGVDFELFQCTDPPVKGLRSFLGTLQGQSFQARS